MKYRLKNKLKIARAETGENQDQIATLLKIAEATYNQKELGKREFTLLECILLSMHFNKTLDYLFMPSEDERNKLKTIFFEQ